MPLRDDSVVFKIFLNDSGLIEVKKFVIDGDTSVITNMIFIKEKLQTIFPKLREANFKITWRDADGDDISLENDEDLIMAFTEMDGPMKMLYVTVLGYPNNQPATSNIICDACNKQIITYRYKCLQCFDYDLCGDCEHAGHHSHHMMLRTSKPDLPFVNCGRRIFDQVNKAVRKANHVAYKECKRRSKWDKKKGDQCHADNCDESRKDGQNPNSSSGGCPFEEYIPHISPFIDAFTNAASQAASAAAGAAANAATNATALPQQEKAPGQPTEGASSDYPAFQFMEAVRNALSAFGLPQHSQQPSTQTTSNEPPQSGSGNTRCQSQPSQGTATTNSTNGVHIDLTKSADEPMDVSGSQREPGWTILNREEQILSQQTQYPVPTPTIVPPTPVQPQVIQAQQVPQAPPQVQPQISPQVPFQVSPQPLPQVPPQAPPPQQQHVIYPQLFTQPPPRAQIQDPRIASGLARLMEMGFSDEEALIALLKRFNGSVDEVIKHIFENK